MIPSVSILDVRSGRYMVWSTDDELTKQLLRDGTHELITSVVSKNIIEASQNKTILDIGANIGSFTIPLARDLGSKAHFYCFEVQKQVYLQLCGNIFLNSLDNVSPYHAAISNKDGNMLIPVVSDYSLCKNIGGYSIDEVATSLERRGDFNQELLSEKISVQSRKIDSLVDLPPACLIKIDVEGHELEVIQGAFEYIKRSGYPPIIFEVWGWHWYEEKKKRTLDYFREVGYDFLMGIDSQHSGNILAQHKDNKDLRVEFDTVGDRNFPARIFHR